MADTISVNINTGSGGAAQYKNLAELTHDIEVLKSRIDELGSTPVYEIDTSSSTLDFGCCYICTIPVQDGAFTLRAPIDEDSVSKCILYINPDTDYNRLTFSIDDDKTFLLDANSTIVSGKWNKIVITSAKDYYSMSVENFKII